MSGAMELEPGWAVYNASTAATNAEVERWCAACSAQLVEFCGAYSRVPVGVEFYVDHRQIPAGMPTAAIVDRSAVDGALASHTQETKGRVTAEIGVLTCRENGVEPSSALSHELLEGDLDPFVNKWADMPDGRREIAVEVCDPVQDQTYEIDGVAVSSYVLPDYWNDRPMKGAKFDRGGILRAPFTRTSGGYFIARDASGRTTQEGERPAYKSPSGRGARRLETKRKMHGPTLDAVRAVAHGHGSGAALIVYAACAAVEKEACA